jgi:hypothetical protein
MLRACAAGRPGVRATNSLRLLTTRSPGGDWSDPSLLRPPTRPAWGNRTLCSPGDGLVPDWGPWLGFLQRGCCVQTRAPLTLASSLLELDLRPGPARGADRATVRQSSALELTFRPAECWYYLFPVSSHAGDAARSLITVQSSLRRTKDPPAPLRLLTKSDSFPARVWSEQCHRYSRAKDARYRQPPSPNRLYAHRYGREIPFS